MHITDMVGRQMQQQQVVQPNERAQIVLAGPRLEKLIVRYKSAATAKKEFAALFATWKKVKTGKHDGIVMLKSDMFDAVVDLSTMSNISLVDAVKRSKFVPIPY